MNESKQTTISTKAGCLIAVIAAAVVGLIMALVTWGGSTGSDQPEPDVTTASPSIVNDEPIVTEDQAVTESVNEQLETDSLADIVDDPNQKITLIYTSEVSDLSVSGSGDDVVSGLHVEGYGVLQVTHEGDSLFYVDAHGAYEGHLVSGYGTYSGAVLLDDSGDYELEITGDGAWTIAASPLGHYGPVFFDESQPMSGTGDYISEVFIPSCKKYQITHSGDGLFLVTMHNAYLGKKEALVTDSGDYSGTVYCDYFDECFFEIKSDGDWTITPIE